MSNSCSKYLFLVSKQFTHLASLLLQRCTLVEKSVTFPTSCTNNNYCSLAAVSHLGRGWLDDIKCFNAIERQLLSTILLDRCLEITRVHPYTPLVSTPSRPGYNIFQILHFSDRSIPHSRIYQYDFQTGIHLLKER